MYVIYRSCPSLVKKQRASAMACSPLLDKLGHGITCDIPAIWYAYVPIQISSHIAGIVYEGTGNEIIPDVAMVFVYQEEGDALGRMERHPQLAL